MARHILLHSLLAATLFVVSVVASQALAQDVRYVWIGGASVILLYMAVRLWRRAAGTRREVLSGFRAFLLLMGGAILPIMGLLLLYAALWTGLKLTMPAVPGFTAELARVEFRIAAGVAILTGMFWIVWGLVVAVGCWCGSRKRLRSIVLGLCGLQPRIIAALLAFAGLRIGVTFAVDGELDPAPLWAAAGLTLSSAMMVYALACGAGPAPVADDIENAFD